MSSTPPPPAAPQPLSDADARLWAMLAHLSGILLAFVGPLIVMLVFGPRSAFVKKQSTEALNFQIMIAIGYVVSFILTFVVIGIFLFFIVWIVDIIFCIVAGLAANKGEDYRYPVSIRLVK